MESTAKDDKIVAQNSGFCSKLWNALCCRKKKQEKKEDDNMEFDERKHDNEAPSPPVLLRVTSSANPRESPRDLQHGNEFKYVPSPDPIGLPLLKKLNLGKNKKQSYNNTPGEY